MNEAPAPAGRSTLPELLSAAAVLAGELCLLGPAAVLLENRSEFASPQGRVAVLLVASFALLVALLVGIGLLAGRFRDPYVAALLAVALLLWLETAISGRFQLLDGSAIDWSRLRTREILEALGWLTGIALAVRLGRRRRRILWIAAACVLFAQAGSTSWLFATGGGTSTESAVGDSPAETLTAMARLSSTRNVLVLVLDATQRGYVTDRLRADRDLRERFAGFTLYSDHLAPFPTTRFSLPAMLSGRIYDNAEPIPEFVAAALHGESSLPRRFGEQGFDVGLASIQLEFLDAPAASRILVRGPFGARGGARFAALRLLDLSLFRYGPITVKRWVFNTNSWRLQTLADDTARRFHATASQDFLDRFTRQMTIGSERATFRFLHVGGAHAPAVLDGDCRFLGVRELTPESYGEQVECVLRQAAALLERLEELGILDETLVVLTSDHGAGLPPPPNLAISIPESVVEILGLAASTLMVKPFGAREPLRFDDRPTSVTTLVSALQAVLGDSASEAVGPRRFSHYSWHDRDWREPYIGALHIFEVGENSSNLAAWRYLETRLSPDLDAGERQHHEFAARSLKQRFPGPTGTTAETRTRSW